MPIFNPTSDNLTEKILEALEGIELSGGGGGNPRYRHSASGKMQLAAGEIIPVLPATKDPVSREVRLAIANPGMKVTLFWGNSPDDPEAVLMTIQSGQTFYDPFDGGMRLNAIAPVDCEVVVIIRQDVEIDYKLATGDELVANTHIDLWIDTTFNYADRTNDWDLYDKITEATESIDNIDGFKLFHLSAFNPGESLKLTIDASQALYNPPITIQWLNPEKFLWLMMMLGIHDISNDDPVEFVEDMTGEFIWAGQILDPTGGEVIIKPTLNYYLGRIVAKNSSNQTDTCIIKSWQPDIEDPTQGGTLVLEGF